MNRVYRPDIDGLRAYAVFAVLLFHLDFEFASGGFIGVDIFFVISGFLITGLIRNELINSGHFDFTNFYVRRIRRLFPALFVTIFLSTIMSFLLFSPPHLERTGGAIIHALTSLSNFYFWTEADYFDSAAAVKPLLHTWSLSVEEQFYFIWPFLFVALIKTRSNLLMLFALSGMIILSLFLNYHFQDGQVGVITELSSYAASLISDGESTIFYLLPFRLYEFAIGGSLVFLSNKTIENKSINELLTFIGILLITYSFIEYSSETLFPSHNALLPCIGTALIIYSSNRARLLGLLFNNRIAIGLGLISYSIYLVHWPIIVFWKYYTFRPISTAAAISIIIVSIIAAFLMYRFVEKPIKLARGSDQTRTPIATIGVAGLFSCFLIFTVASNMWVNNGWSWRLATPSASNDLIPPKVEQKTLKENKLTPWTNALVLGRESQNPKNVLVIGDSHAGQLIGAAKYLVEKYDLTFTFYTFTGCPPIFGTYKVYGYQGGSENTKNTIKEPLKQVKCREQTKMWEEYILENRFDYVILSSRWNWLFEKRDYYNTVQRRDLLIDKNDPQFTVAASKAVFSKHLDNTVKTIQKTGTKVILFGQVPHAGIDLEGCNNVPGLLFSESDINDRCNYVPREYVLQRSEYSNFTVKKIASDNSALSVIPTDYFCREETKYCQLFYKGRRLKDDDDHINEYGSVFLAKKWEQESSFPFHSLKRNHGYSRPSVDSLSNSPLISNRTLPSTP